jgi:hypothetical protein
MWLSFRAFAPLRTLTNCFTNLRLILRTSLVLLVPVYPASGQTPPPGGPMTTVISDYELPPTSVELAWNKVALIAVVKIRQSQAHDLRVGRSGTAVPVTDHAAEVLEVLKGAGLGVGTRIVVRQDSAAPANGSPKHTSGGRIFQPNEEYVLFLTPNGDGTFQIAWGPGGVFPSAGDTVQIPGGARRMWQSREEVPRDEFLGTLRKLRNAKSVK